MSFILDALRRAEAERARGHVPGLHTPTVTDLQAADAAIGRRRTGRGRAGGWWLAAGALGLLALTAGIAWWLGRARPGPEAPVALPSPQPAGLPAPAVVALGPVPPVPPSSSAGASPTPEAAAVSPAPEAAVAPPLPAPAPPPPRPSTQPAAPVAAPARAPAPSPGVGPAATTPPVKPAAREPATVGRPMPADVAPAAPAPAPVPAAAPVAAAVPWLADLPALRGQLPALAVAGGLYSDQAEQRLVIVNGQVAREGEVVLPGLRLEQIRPRSVVFSFQGQRFAVPM